MEEAGEGPHKHTKFAAYLKEAHETDLSTIEYTGCVVRGKDASGQHILSVIPGLAIRSNSNIDEFMKLMLLLFVREANEIVGDPYIIVYGHSASLPKLKYPLIYKFYSTLPRNYKKNIQQMYIIHPNSSIKFFFAYAKVFLNQKFYKKLCLVKSILDFQQITAPSLYTFPPKFHQKEDEDFKMVMTSMVMPPIADTFDSNLCATALLHACKLMLQASGRVHQIGIFRVAGDEAEFGMVKNRLHKMYLTKEPVPMFELSLDSKSILFGTISVLSDSKQAPVQIGKIDMDNLNNDSEETASPAASQDMRLSIVEVSNPDTVAQIFKMCLRDLAEPLVPYGLYYQLKAATRKFQEPLQDMLSKIAGALAALPYENLATLDFIMAFLREVAAEASSNSMDSSNLAKIFSASILPFKDSDPIVSLQESAFSQLFMKVLIEEPQVLRWAIHRSKGGEGVDGDGSDIPSYPSYSMQPPAPPSRTLPPRPGADLGQGAWMQKDTRLGVALGLDTGSSAAAASGGGSSSSSSSGSSSSSSSSKRGIASADVGIGAYQFRGAAASSSNRGSIRITSGGSTSSSTRSSRSGSRSPLPELPTDLGGGLPRKGEEVWGAAPTEDDISKSLSASMRAKLAISSGRNSRNSSSQIRAEHSSTVLGGGGGVEPAQYAKELEDALKFVAEANEKEAAGRRQNL